MKRARFELIYTLIFIAIGACLVLVPPGVGVANNGDFERLMYLSNYAYPDIRDVRGVTFRFLITQETPPVPPMSGLTYFSQSGPSRLGGVLNRCFGHGQDAHATDVDLRWSGLVQILLLAGAYLLLLRATRSWRNWRRSAVAIVSMLIFLDMGYLPYVNTFYAEPTSRGYLLLAVAVLLNLWDGMESEKGGRFGWLVAYFLFAVLCAATKGQNAPLIVPMALLGIYAGWQFRSRGARWVSVAMGLAGVFLVSHSLARYDPAMLRMNKYDTVFKGLLLQSPDPEKDLKELGLPPKLARLAGTNPWMPGSGFSDPSFQIEFFPKVTYPRVTLFYLRHPARFFPLLAFGCHEMTGVRLDYLGNFSRESGIRAQTLPDLVSSSDLPPGARWKWPGWQVFSIWSALKETWMPGRVWFWAAFSMVNLAAGVYQVHCHGSRQVKVAGAIRCCIVVLYVVIPPLVIIGDGNTDLRKHLFLANVAFDLLALFCIADLIGWIELRLRHRKLLNSSPALPAR